MIRYYKALSRRRSIFKLCSNLEHHISTSLWRSNGRQENQQIHIGNVRVSNYQYIISHPDYYEELL